MRLLVKSYLEGLCSWRCDVLDGDMIGKEIYIDLCVNGDLQFEDVKKGMIVEVDCILPFCYIAHDVTIAS